MAQVDTGFYSTLQAPDIAGGIANGMKLSQLANQNKIQNQQIADQQAMRDAYQKNLAPDAQGNLQLNKQGMLSQLAKTSPQQAFEMQKTLAQNERDAQAAQIQAAKDHLGLIGQTLNGVTDENSYQAAKAQALKNGWAKPGELPDSFDPNHIKQLQAQTMDAHAYLDAQMKERGLVNDETKTGIEGRKADNEAYANQLKAAELHDNRYNAKLQHTEDNLSKIRSDPAGIKADTQISAALTGHNLIGSKKDPNDLTYQDARAATADYVRALTGGVPTEGEMDSMVPKGSIWNQAKRAALGAIGVQNVGAGLGDYMKHLDDRFKDLDASGRQVLTKRQHEIAYGSGLKPEDAAALADRGIPPQVYGPEQRSSVAAQPHPQDDQAVQWAMKNPNDPRAAQILQMNGHAVGKR